MNSTGTPKIDRTGLTDAQYIAALDMYTLLIAS